MHRTKAKAKAMAMAMGMPDSQRPPRRYNQFPAATRQRWDLADASHCRSLCRRRRRRRSRRGHRVIARTVVDSVLHGDYQRQQEKL